MPEMSKLSLSLDQVRSFKEFVTCKAPYANRVSLGFAYGLALLDKQFREGPDILRELDVLEGLISHSSIKEATQFKRQPLHPFWHRHFSTARHLIRNIGERWGLGKGGNHDLSERIAEEAVAYGDQPDLWQKRIVHNLVIGGLEDRSAAQRMTGDWIIFAKHEGQNIYLGLAAHQKAEHDADQLLYDKLRQGSAWEFPFLFE